MKTAREFVDEIGFCLGAPLRRPPQVLPEAIELIEKRDREAKLEVLRELVRRLVSPYGGSVEEVIDELRTELERESSGGEGGSGG